MKQHELGSIEPGRYNVTLFRHIPSMSVQVVQDRVSERNNIARIGKLNISLNLFPKNSTWTKCKD
ncbi:hypothetical protein [Pleionea mediterranea]|uniref:Uncharacterized protein n=1 Tax=Pleionea mediterranea TaxID=523701 RepID=A0A316FXH0_9GAMM|nr:hypothetical protein [Pleionea mediterranea]PWK52815.1 hypothetical protein C8D97_10433 [Pleionea mediterranea]